MVRAERIDNDGAADAARIGTRASRLASAGGIRRAVLVWATLAGVLFGLRATPAQHLASLSADLLRWQTNPSSDRVRVIVPGTRTALEALLRQHPLPVVRWLSDAVVLTADRAELLSLAGDSNVASLSGDALVSPAMAIATRSTGADQAWRGRAASFPFGPLPGVTGAGIGIAIVDSGISPHLALAGKVVASVSFVSGDPRVADAYGHGTHVAGIVAAAAMPAAGAVPAFAGGIAPGASLINVRVLGANGVGYTSDVIAGIDWAVAHRSDYNIRVINLSIGHPVMEPAITDPLGQAVARAVAQGIVVAASAGNNGRDSTGAPVLGGIGSPGNSPFALTVGALSTMGTIDRGDDTVADYSSRGPTRFDFALKPDLVAPGTGIVSLEAAGSYLPIGYPSVHSAGAATNAYMRLSGTSMATPMVSAAAALLLQGSPGLTVSQVKLALQTGATYVADAGLMGAGAGSLNIAAARAIAANGLSAIPTPAAADVKPSGAAFWDAGSLAAGLYAGSGVRLVSLLDLANVWLNPALLPLGGLNVVGLLNPLRFVPANRLLWGDQVSTWIIGDGQIIWGTTIFDSRGNQIIWGTTDTDDQIIWGTTTLTAADAR